MKRIIRTSLVSLVLLICLQAFSQKIECFVLHPAEIQLEGVYKIGIVDFKGKHSTGVKLSSYLIEALFESERGIYDYGGQLWGLVKKKEGKTYVNGFSTNIFELVERDQLEKVLKEQRLGVSGAIDERSAAEVGRILGLDAMLIGSADYNTKVDNRKREALGLDGKVKTYHCKKNVVNAYSSIKIIDVETARILGTKNFEKEMDSEKCTEYDKFASHEQLLDACLKTLSQEMANYFAPYYTKQIFSPEKIYLKDFKKKAKQAENHLEKGQIEKAYYLYKGIFDADSYNPSAAYNLAIVYEMIGHYAQAHEHYGYAYELEPANKYYQDGYERTAISKAMADNLASIGKAIPEYNFRISATKALANSVTTRGSSSVRHDVKEKADDGSKTVAKVPGGLEFRVISTSGDWYRIELRGGKTGYLHKSQIL